MNPDSLDGIYQKYVNDLYRYLFSLCRKHHTAQDLVQETFYRAYLYLENCKDERVKPWLFRVAYNAFIDVKRKEKYSFVQDQSYFRELADKETPEKKMIEWERRNEMEQWILDLPEKQKQAILLHDYNGLTYQEASDIMGIGLSHFKVVLFRARQKLRREKERTEPYE